MYTEAPDVILAQQYAEIVHAGKLYADEVPYTVHLKNVVEVLKRFGVTDPAMLSAAWLHDSIEDCGVSYNDIRKRFGENVAELVYKVTSELGRNRKERNYKTYPKIAGDIWATQLKLADRIANVEYGMATGGKNDMYSKEYSGFEIALRFMPCAVPRFESLEPMWKYLSKLLSIPKEP